VTDKQHIHRYGTVAGTWVPAEQSPGHSDGNVPRDRAGAFVAGREAGGAHGSQVPGKAISVKHFIEKPSEEQGVELQRAMPEMPPDTFLTVFGLYVINDPEGLWAICDEHLTNNLRDSSGDFSFTAALARLMGRSGLRGMIVDGCRVDLGVPAAIPCISAMGPS